MRSETFKVLTDNNGKKCRFNNTAFSDAIRAVSDRSKVAAKAATRKGKDSMSTSDMLTASTKAGKAKIRTQTDIMNQIADQTGFSFEAVKKWKQGDNGPSSYDAIEIAAAILEVSESQLITFLTPEKQGVRKMSAKEKEVIEMVFQRCVEVFYEFDNMIVAVQSKDSKERRAARKEVYKEMRKLVDRIHMIVDKNFLYIDSSVADRLHNIISEFALIDNPTDMDRWEEACAETTEEGKQYTVDTRDIEILMNYCFSREDGIYYLGAWYINFEIALAERYEHFANNSLPDGYYPEFAYDGTCCREDGSEVPMEEMMEYGCRETDQWGEPLITPRMICRDQVVTLLKGVFFHDFPELNLTQNL